MTELGRVTGLVAVAALVAIGCQSGDLPTKQNGVGPEFDHAPNGATDVQMEQFKICKHGSSASFSVTNGNNATENLTDGECRTIQTSGTGVTVTVTETGAQAGYEFDYVEVTTILAGTTTFLGSFTDPTVVGHIDGDEGVLAVYFNKPIETVGGQGCTPGYWKQEQHFDSWTSPYDPTDLFSDHFEDAFGGMTLAEVLAQGGGGLAALGRHTVAALLNGASGGVSYGQTDLEVIAAFNAVYPGTKGDYNTLKNSFAVANEAGCPLN